MPRRPSAPPGEPRRRHAIRRAAIAVLTTTFQSVGGVMTGVGVAFTASGNPAAGWALAGGLGTVAAGAALGVYGFEHPSGGSSR